MPSAYIHRACIRRTAAAQSSPNLLVFLDAQWRDVVVEEGGSEGGFAAGDGLSSECGLGVGKIVSRTRRRHVLRDGLRPTRVNNIV